MFGDDYIVSGYDGFIFFDFWYIYFDGFFDGQFGGKLFGIGSGNSGCDFWSGFSVFFVQGLEVVFCVMINEVFSCSKGIQGYDVQFRLDFSL